MNGAQADEAPLPDRPTWADVMAFVRSHCRFCGDHIPDPENRVWFNRWPYESVCRDCAPACAAGLLERRNLVAPDRYAVPGWQVSIIVALTILATWIGMLVVIAGPGWWSE